MGDVLDGFQGKSMVLQAKVWMQTIVDLESIENCDFESDVRVLRKASLESLEMWSCP